jgi:hypothetical protein
MNFKLKKTPQRPGGQRPNRTFFGSRFHDFAGALRRYLITARFGFLGG